MSDSTAVVWFRRDLRRHDNRALTAAAESDAVLPVYAFDPRNYGPAAFGGEASFEFEKTGPHRTRFRRESVLDLRSGLRADGSDLLVRHERPEVAVPAVAEAVGADAVHYHTRPTAEETAVEDAVRTRLEGTGVEFRGHWGHTLHDREDLPSGVEGVPDTFTSFRKRVEGEGDGGGDGDGGGGGAPVRDPLDRPDLPGLPGVDVEDRSDPVPTPERLGVEEPSTDDRGVLPFEGGESAGLDRLETYVWAEDRLREYKRTRNGLLGADYSSKLAAWLNEGCLSPRYVHREVERYEDERVSNESTYWLVFELRWRDFFAFQFAKHGDVFFSPGGIRRREVDWRDDDADFERWAAGETGVPFVDANMRELNATGYMSNRGRQNAASFLANDLRIDWRRGGAHFETMLVDYDPCSNYGNWAYVAGVGNDSRDRKFDVLSQARRYDDGAEYTATWVPELADLPPKYVLEPWRMSGEEQAERGVELGVDYPEPMVDPDDL